jgi:hypothetical protein
MSEQIYRVQVVASAVGWYEVRATSRRKAVENTNAALSMSPNPWSHLDIIGEPHMEVTGVQITELPEETAR